MRTICPTGHVLHLQAISLADSPCFYCSFPLFTFASLGFFRNFISYFSVPISVIFFHSEKLLANFMDNDATCRHYAMHDKLHQIHYFQVVVGRSWQLVSLRRVVIPRVENCIGMNN